MIRVAMLSFWHVHGKDYAHLAEACPDTEIAAVWDENPERGQAEAAQCGRGRSGDGAVIGFDPHRRRGVQRNAVFLD